MCICIRKASQIRAHLSRDHKDVRGQATRVFVGGDSICKVRSVLWGGDMAGGDWRAAGAGEAGRR